MNFMVIGVFGAVACLLIATGMLAYRMSRAERALGLLIQLYLKDKEHERR